MSNSTEINVSFPETENLHLRLAVGACRLRIVPDDGPQWVTGSYDDPSNAVPLRISEEGNVVRISQEFNWPATFGRINRPPTFNLKLGKGKPYLLTVEGGATESEIDLGGLPLRGLTVKYGAGKQEFDFSAPNPEVMEQLTISAGAAAFEMEHLANANFTQMTLEGGAASFELDFGGALQRDTQVKINTGMASVELEIPTTTAAKINAEAVLGGVEVGDGFMKKEGAFWNEAALADKTPVLWVSAQVVMGAIELKGN
jgi:hypothetical protein